ncbi:MAG: DMT family transporter [Roseiflexaceae bacterium]|nr:DMT family transporter [Roseiflexaceae bacterium]
MNSSVELAAAPRTGIVWSRGGMIALLMLATLIWGSTFLVVQQTLALVGPFTFLTLRFAVATLALAVIFRRRLRALRASELRAGALIGVVIFAAFSLQTLGLQYITSSKAGFITSLYVPLVPLFAIVFLRQWPSALAWLGVAISLSGLLLLSLNDQLTLALGRGEWLMLGCAVACALHIVAVGKYAPQADPIRLTVVQLAITTLLCALAVPITGEPLVEPPALVWGSVLFIGLLATAFCLAAMNFTQQHISSVQATLIYALEPAWAGLFGFLAGEALATLAWVGCGLIFAGLIVSSLPLPGRQAQ